MDFQYTYILRRSRRKTVGLTFDSSGALVVKAPLALPRGEIDAVVGRHGAWIEKHRARLEEALLLRAAFSWSDGDAVPVLGTPRRLATGGRGVALEEDRLVLGGDLGDRPAAVERFLRELAAGVVADRVGHYAPGLGVAPTGLSITGARRRWGSCSPADRLCFSWRLICMPPRAVDAVVVHELCHILYRDHSRGFYRAVEGVLPDYRERHRLLCMDSIPF